MYARLKLLADLFVVTLVCMMRCCPYKQNTSHEHCLSYPVHAVSVCSTVDAKESQYRCPAGQWHFRDLPAELWE